MTVAGTLQILQDLAKSSGAGPAPVFSHIHIADALLLIGDEGPKGRIELSRQLGLGEGAIRTIIRRLTIARIIATGQEGCQLTRRGVLLYKRLRRKLSRVEAVDPGQLSLDKVSAAIVVRASGRTVKRGVEQRDAAVRAGATGACTLVYKSGTYLMPMADEDWKLSPQDSLGRDLNGLFAPKDNDVIIIASAPEKEIAEHSAMAAALTLVE
jgi:predicted transcriptional regulator